MISARRHRVSNVSALAAMSGCGLVISVASAQFRGDAVYRHMDGFTIAAGTPDAAGGTYDASGVTLLDHIPLNGFPLNPSSANDVWGYASPLGREYAIIGLSNGTAFVDITDPANASIIAEYADANSVWSDIAVYGQYAYNVNETGGGMQVFDLTQIDSGVVTLLTTMTDGGLSTSHNVFGGASLPRVYLCGSNLSGGLVAVNIVDPGNPSIAGMWNEASVHDTQIVGYPSGVYREVAFNFCGGSGLRIVDVSDASNMQTISTLSYPNMSFTHQGWVTEDRRYVLIDDELDELNSPGVSTSTTYVINIEDLENPYFVTSFTNNQVSIDHNLMVVGTYMFAANYTSGLRVFDVTDVTAAFEVGFFDTHPGASNLSFNGAWGVYAGLPSRVVLVSDFSGGLFVLDVSAVTGGCPPVSPPTSDGSFAPANRYLALAPSGAGGLSALAVTLSDLWPPFDGLNGTQMYVNAPQTVSTSMGDLQTATLGCNPTFLDWSQTGIVYVSGEAIMPQSTYQVRTLLADCTEGCDCSSASIPVQTVGDWGDIVPPSGTADFGDILAIVQRFRGVPWAPDVVHTDLDPLIPNQEVDFLDALVAVKAFQSHPYPFSGPNGCP